MPGPLSRTVHRTRPPPRLQSDVDPPRCDGHEFESVPDEILDQPRQQLRVAPDENRLLGQRERDLTLALQGLQPGDDLAGDRAEIAGREVQLHLAGFHLAHVEHRVDHLDQDIGGFDDVARRSSRPFSESCSRSAVLEEMREHGDGRQRIAQVVDDHVDEAVAQGFELPQPVIGFLQRLLRAPTVVVEPFHLQQHLDPGQRFGLVERL